MAYITLTQNHKHLIMCGAFFIPPALAGFGLVKWGGHLVGSLANAGFVRASSVAVVQSAVSLFFIADPLDKFLENYIDNEKVREAVVLTSSNIIAGTAIYTIFWLAVKAGLIATALTLPAVAALVVGAALMTTIGVMSTEFAVDYADKKGWIKITK